MLFLKNSNIEAKAQTIDAWLKQWQEANAGKMTSLVAYREVPWVRRSVDLLAGAVSTQPFGLYRGDTRIATEVDYRQADLDFDVNLRQLLKGLAWDILMFGYAHWAFTGVDGYQVVRRRAARHMHYYYDVGNAVYRFDYRRGSYLRQAMRWQSIQDDGMPYVWEEAESDEKPGTAKVHASLKAAGVLNASADTEAAFFANGGAGPVIFQFENYQNAPQAEKDRVQNWLDRFIRGVTNINRPLAMGSNVDIKKVGYSIKDLETTEVSREKREEALVPFGVPASLVLPSAANYATAQIDKLNFHDYGVNPLCDMIFDALNERWLQLYDLEIRSEHQRLQVYQTAELERSDKLIPQFTVGLISRREFRDETGRDPDVPADDVIQGTFVETSAPEAEADRQRAAVGRLSAKFQPSGEAFAYIPLANDPQVLEIVRMLREEIGDMDGVEWQAAPTYHVTLAYAPEVSGAVLRAVSDRVPARRIQLWDTGTLGVFENGDERALHIQLEKNIGLMEFQATLYEAFNRFGVTLSPFSNPQQYTPHITLAYLPADLDVTPLLQKYGGMIDSHVDSYIIARDNYEPEVVVSAPAYKANRDEHPAAADLRRWASKARKRFEEGTPEKGLAFESDTINHAMKAAIVSQLEVAETVEDVQAAFEGAEVWANYG
jgi:2'-5' RNA ligase